MTNKNSGIKVIDIENIYNTVVANNLNFKEKTDEFTNCFLQKFNEKNPKNVKTELDKINEKYVYKFIKSYMSDDCKKFDIDIYSDDIQKYIKFILLTIKGMKILYKK